MSKWACTWVVCDLQITPLSSAFPFGYLDMGKQMDYPKWLDTNHPPYATPMGYSVQQNGATQANPHLANAELGSKVAREVTAPWNNCYHLLADANNPHHPNFL